MGFLPQGVLPSYVFYGIVSLFSLMGILGKTKAQRFYARKKKLKALLDKARSEGREKDVRFYVILYRCL